MDSSKTMASRKQCQRCQAPLFLNQTTDWYGNSVLTLNCWNGHYSWIKIEDIEELEPVRSKVPVESNTEAVAYIGFFSLK